MDEPLLWAAAAAAVLSGFFSLNAYALRGSSRRDLEEAFSLRPAPRLGKLIRHLADLEMACALLRSLGALSLAALLLVRSFGSGGASAASAVLAVAVAGAIVSVVVVAVPGAWARHAGAKVLAVTSPVLQAVRIALWPVVRVMRAFDLPIRRLSGAPAPAGENDNGHNEALEDAVKAEILHVASEAQAEGAVDEDEMEMIESVIEFGDTRAGEIMMPRTDIDALPADATGREMRARLLQPGHTRIPIYEGDIDHIVGILHAKDLLAVDDLATADLRELMRKPFFVPETKPLDDLLREFKAGKAHMAIVLDEYGGTAGLVTVEDLIEEIVGDISDEHDRPASALIRRIDERTLEVDGRAYIDDLNDAARLALPEDEDYDTVAGFVISELGFIPPVGEKLASRGATFTVLDADARKITRLRVELPARHKAG